MRRSIFLLLFAMQLPPVPLTQEVRLDGRVFAVLVPNGWKSDAGNAPDIRLLHASGASFTFRSMGRSGIPSLEAAARLGVDRAMTPLGFASFGAPLERKVNGSPAIQYRIEGNRLSDHRSLLYLAIRREDGFYEIIYENSESAFPLLLPEVERIGGSIEQRIVTRSTRGRRP